MSNINPSSAYRELGRQLLQIREAAGLTTRQLAAKADLTNTMISRMENGRRISSTPDVILYVMNCGLTMIEARPLVELCRIAERKVGYYISDAKIGGSLQSLIFHETAAKQSVIYEPQAIHGLLQTPGYTRAHITGLNPTITEERLAGAIQTRKDRRRILSRRNSGRFTFYIPEQALRLPVSSNEVMAEQLLHLVFTAAMENVTVRIVPTAVGPRSVFGGAFHLMEFEEYRPLVYLDDLHVGGLIIEDRDHVSSYYELVPKLDEVALVEGQSREFAAALADAYDRGSLDGVADGVAQEHERRGNELC